MNSASPTQSFGVSQKEVGRRKMNFFSRAGKKKQTIRVVGFLGVWDTIA